MRFFNWLKSKNKRERLRAKYCSLMKRAYEIAPRNKSKSDYFNKKAREILQEIKHLDLNHQHHRDAY